VIDPVALQMVLGVLTGWLGPAGTGAGGAFVRTDRAGSSPRSGGQGRMDSEV